MRVALIQRQEKQLARRILPSATLYLKWPRLIFRQVFIYSTNFTIY